MARIIVSGTMVRYPVGGIHQWMLTWLLGFQRLGHDVYFVEKSGWKNSCYDVGRRIMTDDCTYGIGVVSGILKRFGLNDQWCFVDASNQYHGRLSPQKVEEVFKTCDLFVDMEGDEWLNEATHSALRVFVDCEPGWFQMKMEMAINEEKQVPDHDYYYTTGRNVGTQRSTTPSAGKNWRTICSPVNVDLFPYQTPRADAPFTTVMNWQSNKEIEFNGIKYGQKDMEFPKFLDLPQQIESQLEVAVSGPRVPKKILTDSGWRVRNADDISNSIDSYKDYILASKGEFSVMKNVFVATNCGTISDRSGYYMASGRPAVVQDTGFSEHLPCGRGLFAVRTMEEAAAAIKEINADYEHHSHWARDIALEYMDASKVLKQFLIELGI